MGESVCIDDSRRPFQQIVIRFDQTLASAPRALLAAPALPILISLGDSLLVGPPESLSVLDSDELAYSELATDLAPGNYAFQKQRVLGSPVFVAGLQLRALAVSPLALRGGRPAYCSPC